MFSKIYWYAYLTTILSSFSKIIEKQQNPNHEDQKPNFKKDEEYKIKFYMFSKYCFYCRGDIDLKKTKEDWLFRFKEICEVNSIEESKEIVYSEIFFLSFKNQILKFIEMLRKNKQIKIYDHISDFIHIFEIFPAIFGLYKIIDERMVYCETGRPEYLLCGIDIWNKLLLSIHDYSYYYQIYMKNSNEKSIKYLNDFKESIYFSCLDKLKIFIRCSFPSFFEENNMIIYNLSVIMNHYIEEERHSKSKKLNNDQKSDLWTFYRIFWPILLMSKDYVWNNECHVITEYKSLYPHYQYRFNYRERENSTNPLRHYLSQNLFDGLDYLFFTEIRKYKYLALTKVWDELKMKKDTFEEEHKNHPELFDLLLNYYKDLMKKIIDQNRKL